MPKQCVIVNPRAGSARQLEEIAAGVARLDGAELVMTTGPRDAEGLARQAAERGFERVVAGGGDGTLNEVLNGLAGFWDRVELGLLPLGTANDFARTVQIPTDIAVALAILDEGHTRSIDVAKIMSGSQPYRYFLNAAAGGFSAVVDEKLESGTKHALGKLAYALSAMQALSELQIYRMHIECDGEAALDIDALNFVVANGCYVGGGVFVAPNARPDDGLLDLVVFRAMAGARIPVVTAKALLGQHGQDDDVLVRQVRRLRLSAEPPFSLNTDGELAHICPVTFEAMPRAIAMVTPAAANE